MIGMERFVRRQNVEHFREMLKIATDPERRRVLEKMLLEEESKLNKLEEDPRRRK